MEFPKNQPLVTIICLCHNHASYVKEALDSAIGQVYDQIELIIVDDASTDGSKEVIEEWLLDKPHISFINLKENLGNCKAFNQGLAIAKGKYVIDLAADDLLLPERVAVGVQDMEAAGDEWGLHISDAWYIDASGAVLYPHYKRNAQGELLKPVPHGWVYREVLERFFICTPTMMMRRSVLDALGGYDEKLAYEDFDFWVRASRHWKFFYADKILVKKRVLPLSWSTKQYKLETAQLASTLEICRKAKALNQNAKEDKALGKRLSYEIRQAIRHKHTEVGREMLALKKEVWPVRIEDWLLGFLLNLL